MELKSGHKQTEVGVIPEDWDTSTVGREFSVQLGKMLDSEKNIGSPKPYLGNRAVQWGKIDSRELATIRMSDADLIKYRLKDGDLLVCEGGEVGRSAIWNSPVDECYYQKALHRLRSIRGYNSNYMLAVLEQWSKHGVLDNFVTQTSIAHLPKENFVNVPIPLPPPAEQAAIATVLGDVEALLAAQDALIEKKSAIKRGAMQELLSGQRRLPGFSGAWEVRQLGSLLGSPVTDGPHLTPKFLDRGVPFLSVNNLIDGKIDWSDLRYISDVDHSEFSRKCRPQQGDILFGKAASVGTVAFVETKAEFNIWSPIALIRTAPQFSAKFVYHQLQSISVEKQVLLLTNSSSQGNIGMGDIEKLEIAYPKSRSEQIAIAALLDDIDCEITLLEAQRVKTAQLKQGMMQELLTGKTRLV